jgi:Protein of unknown function (DUF3703)
VAGTLSCTLSWHLVLDPGVGTENFENQRVTIDEERNVSPPHAKPSAKARRLADGKAHTDAFAAASAVGNQNQAWKSLDLAHIFTQPFAWPHIHNHWLMLGYAWKTRNFSEWLAQVPRILLAGPGSLTGRAPSGNPGTSRVGIFETAPVPLEVAELLSLT